MPNTLTNLKDIRVAQTALPASPMSCCLRGVQHELLSRPGEKGDTVRVPLVGAPRSRASLPVTTPPTAIRRWPLFR